jgi:hypothetical protein
MDKLLIYILSFLIGIILYKLLYNRECFINISNDLKLTAEYGCDSEPQECTNKIYEQCGGKDYIGETCCPANTICKDDNENWSGCYPPDTPPLPPVPIKACDDSHGSTEITVSIDLPVIPDIIKGYFFWAWVGFGSNAHNSDGTSYFSEPESSNVSVIFYGDGCLEGNKPDIKISNYGTIAAKIKLFNFGGNGDNPISIIELNKINKNLLKRINESGYNGICFDIEANVADNSPSFELFNEKFKLLKDYNFIVLVTVSWFRPYAWTTVSDGEDADSFIINILQCENIDIIAPQLYSSNCNDRNIYNFINSHIKSGFWSENIINAWKKTKLKIVPIVNKAEIDTSNNRVKDFDADKIKPFLKCIKSIFSNYDGNSYMDYVTANKHDESCTASFSGWENNCVSN